MVEPVEQPPKNQRISKDEANFPYRRFGKVGETIGFDKTFDENVWEDENTWNDRNVWGS